MKAGPRNNLITIERATVTTNDYGHEVPTWATYCQEYADVRFSNGSERREAAQESASVAATFIVLSNTDTRSASVTDRILFDGGIWDIVKNIPSRVFNDGREIEAVRAAA